MRYVQYSLEVKWTCLWKKETMDNVLFEAERLFLLEDYRSAIACIRSAPPTEDKEWQAERRRFMAWALLAQGETKIAYELFWSCAQHEGARAGILILTVLAGQVETAVGNWQRHCEKLTQPPLTLPDARWHAPSVVRPALMILERYPFEERSPRYGAACVYQALLHHTQNDNPESFRALGKVTDFYAPARLLRDRWMDDLLCLPLPKNAGNPFDDAARLINSENDFALRNPGEVVARAAHILLYPDLETLQKQCARALEDGRYLDALEVLRRMLFLDPQHTQGLETRWRLHLKLEDTEAAKDDLFYLMDLYEKEKQIIACQKVANQAIELFPEDERALLKMCFLQARLGNPNHLAQYGRKLLRLCREQGLHERANSYRRWLLRQNLTLDDRFEFEVS
jgi:tetratricopeptide (TPR) repeat protein